MNGIEPPQGFHRTDGADFREETDRRIDQDNGADRTSFGPVLENETQPGRHRQKQDEQALELGEKHAVPFAAGFGVELISPMGGETIRGLLLGESLGDSHLEFFKQLLAGKTPWRGDCLGNDSPLGVCGFHTGGKLTETKTSSDPQSAVLPRADTTFP
jgi:hypothetical protein